ncbi:MAG: TIGR00730 family Rossman fold protein, partial [Hydrogenophaga sp.]|nr:TIGR00730 family Rossman fold protein [Hydrogenophaga sp.]
DNMHERKRMMADKADAFLALPGGIGTFEEFFEVWAWRQLGYHDKPVGLLNVAGYYDGLMAFMRTGMEQQFMSGTQMDLIRVDSDTASLLPELVQAAGLSPAARLDAI